MPRLGRRWPFRKSVPEQPPERDCPEMASAMKYLVPEEEGFAFSIVNKMVEEEDGEKN